MKVKALVLDIDGTLTNSRKEITPVTADCIGRIQEKGCCVILASGRPLFGMRRYARELKLEKYGGYLLSHNGARVVEYPSESVVYQNALPGALLPGLYDFARENGCGLATHNEDTVFSAFEPDRYVALEAHINGMPVRVEDNFVQAVDFAIYKCFMTAQGERAGALAEELRKRYGKWASVYRSEPYFIEIVSKGVDKGDSLHRLAQAVGIRREEMICCGDGFNDMSMIQYAGLGVAMGNAQPEVKAAADYVTGSNDQDGLVHVIEKFCNE